MAGDPTVRVGVDIGGTFTDLVLVDAGRGTVHVGKTLTTPWNLMEGVLRGLRDLLDRTGWRLSDVANIVHGTTVVTNAIIERKGVRVGLITTAGVRDALEMGREFRYDIYDLSLERPEPLVPRHLRHEIDERISVDGEVLRPLSYDRLDQILDDLRAHDVKAVAISLLHAYVNPDHERKLEHAVRERNPDLDITISSDLVPVMREYERTSTVVANADVQPLVRRYLVELEDQLHDDGMEGPLYVMRSSGGLTPVEAAARAPIQLIESGPAGGAMAARFVGERVEEANLIAFDMGGTTAKMCLIDDGEPVIAHEFETARVHRFKRGSGLPLKVPVIEMIEIGAGGGSIARLDRMGLLTIGPDSAGADPGPACYGRGGREPTVTDADLVLGYLDPSYFLGGAMTLDVDAGVAAIDAEIAPGLGRDARGAAAAINQVVNEDMANATRLHVAERGRDLRRYTMLAFGGAGPVHAYRVAQLLGLGRVIFPAGAGTLSALGFLVAPITVELLRTQFSAVSAIDWRRLGSQYAEMEQQALGSLDDLDVDAADVELVCSVEMRFRGQGYEIEVPFERSIIERRDQDALEAAFHAAYRTLFSWVPDGVPAEALTWRLLARGPHPTPDLRFDDHVDVSPSTRPTGRRPAYVPELGELVPTDVYRRERLASGTELVGPAIIEEAQSTTVIGPGALVTVDEEHNLIVDLP